MTTTYDLNGGLSQTGTGDDEVFNLTNNANVADGAGGHDVFSVVGSFNTALGGEGADSISQYTGAGNVSDGGAGDDSVFGTAGNTILGGEGVDYLQLDMTARVDAVSIDFGLMLNGGTISLSDGTVIGGFESIQVNMGAGDDVVVAGPWQSYLAGGAGADTLTGGPASDIMFGGDGNDVLSAKQGPDLLDGGAGDDTFIGGEAQSLASYYAASAAVTVDLADHAAQDTGGAGVDTLEKVWRIAGSTFGDVLSGDKHDNLVLGSFDGQSISYIYTGVTPGVDGDDTLSGAGGDDTIEGGVGNDILRGGKGDDSLMGGAGDDVLTGGMGSDHFIFTDADALSGGKDRITDLTFKDIIDLSGIDGDVNTDGLQALSLVSAYDGGAAEYTVSYRPGSDRTVISIWTSAHGSANAHADFQIVIDGDHHAFAGIVI